MVVGFPSRPVFAMMLRLMVSDVRSLFGQWRFRHPWRPYQAALLDQWDQLASQPEVHIVAPPGSGKTVLGWEGIRRIAKPVLVLVPTLNLQQQWLRRLREFGVDDPGPPVFSEDLRKPGLVTVETYQGLHTIVKREGAAATLQVFGRQPPGVLVLDEAHHLRRSWQKSLLQLRSALREVRTIALTATPPYDAGAVEWTAYVEMCGPIDLEIDMPELVRSGSLCPHQDLIWLCQPGPEALQLVREQQAALQKFVRELWWRRDLIDWLLALPPVAQPSQHLDALLADPDFYLAVAVYLNSTSAETARALVQELGLADLQLPEFGGRFVETLLRGVLERPEEEAPPFAADLKQGLRAVGCWEHRKLHFGLPRALERRLTFGPAKVDAIGRIIETEWRHDAADFHGVVLCDYVRADHFPKADVDLPAVLLGVVPVFEHLRRLRLPEFPLALLTGELVILPHAVMAGEGWGDLGEPLPHAPEYRRIAGWSSGEAVMRVTRLFEEGKIRCLVGTAMLLGEGWDAPSINTLVIASSVGTHVQSHQMRGRALRVNPVKSWKVANIWHLACTTGVDPKGGPELDTLRRRLVQTCGPDLEGERIRTGFERLGLEAIDFADATALEDWNNRQCRLAEERLELAGRWRSALPEAQERLEREIGFVLRSARESAVVKAGVGEILRTHPWLRWWTRWRTASEVRRVAQAVADLEASSLDGTAPVADAEWHNDDLRVAIQGGSPAVQERVASQVESLFNIVRRPRYLFQARYRTYAVPERWGAHRDRAEEWAVTVREKGVKGELIYTRNPEGQRLLLQMREHWLAAHGDQPLLRSMSWRGTDASQ